MKYLGEVNTIGEAWMKFLEELHNNGKIVKYSEDKIIKEETGLVISIKKVILPDNIINKYMVKEEYQWMKDNFHNQGVVKELRNTNSYASRLYNYLGQKNQIDWVIHKLKTDKMSCSATITTFEPLTDISYIPCISMLDFYIENNQLDMYVYARSLDWGSKAYVNLSMLAEILSNVSKEIGIATGGLKLVVKLSRIYYKDFSKVKDILKDYKETELDSNSVTEDFSTSTSEVL